jgi:hypothetical protein
MAPARTSPGAICLEELLRQDPDNPDHLGNLGLYYLDLDLGLIRSERSSNAAFSSLPATRTPA